MDNRKVIRSVTVSAVILLVLAASFCYFYKPIYYRIYPWCRISGTVRVTVDGKPYKLDKESFVNCTYGMYGYEDIYVTPHEDGAAELNIKADGYGEYRVDMVVDDADRTVGLGFYQFNRWNVSELELDIYINRETNTIIYAGWYSDIAENGRKIYHDIDKTQDITDELHINL